MTYIWINPVTESMYQTSVLEKFLKDHQLERVHCRTDWGQIVKDKYKRAVEAGGKTEAGQTAGGVTIADARCPMARSLVESLTEDMKPAEIEPILIHCAREISSREDLRDGNKIITTPCRSLADMGNALKLADTEFMTWNELLSSIGQRPEGKQPEESPIPPGFFAGMEGETESLTGKERIEEYVTSGRWRRVRLVEMLYCDRGCHNGDGVVSDET